MDLGLPRRNPARSAPRNCRGPTRTLHRILPFHFFAGLFVESARSPPAKSLALSSSVSESSSVSSAACKETGSAPNRSPNCQSKSLSACSERSALLVPTQTRRPTRRFSRKSCRLARAGAFGCRILASQSCAPRQNIALERPFRRTVRALLFGCRPFRAELSCTINARCSPNRYKAFGIVGSHDQPLVIAFADGLLLRESPILSSIRAELRGLGAALLLVNEAWSFAFQPDDELDLNGRRDRCGPEACVSLRRACGLRATPAQPTELSLVVLDGDGLLVGVSTSSPPRTDYLRSPSALRAAGQEAIATRHPLTLSRRDVVLRASWAPLHYSPRRVPGPCASAHDTPGARRPRRVQTRTVALNIKGKGTRSSSSRASHCSNALRERLELTGSKKGCESRPMRRVHRARRRATSERLFDPSSDGRRRTDHDHRRLGPR